MAGRTELLAGLYGGQAYTTPEVLDELKNGVKKGYSFLEPVVREIEKPDSWLRIAPTFSAEEYRLRKEFDLVLHPDEAFMSRGLWAFSGSL